MSEIDRNAYLLIADDDPDDKMMIMSSLKKADIKLKVECVQDGQQLLEYLSRCKTNGDNSGLVLPSLILLDLNMPKIDGRQALREIKSKSKWSRIPIVVLTTSQSKQDIVEIYGLGANSYCIKPDSYQNWVNKIGHIVTYWFNISERPY